MQFSFWFWGRGNGSQSHSKGGERVKKGREPLPYKMAAATLTIKLLTNDVIVFILCFVRICT